MSFTKPPVAARHPHQSVHHGITLDDPYFWLRDGDYPIVDNPEILAYLKEENDYFTASMAPLEPLTQTLLAELKARQQPDEAAVPWKEGDFEYQWQYAGQDAEYKVWSRWPVGAPDERTLILDEPALAAGHPYFALGALDVSPSSRYLVFATDTDGSERYTLRVKDLDTGRILEDEIPGAAGDVAWSNDSTTFFYTLLSDNWRPYLVKSHRLGTSPQADRAIYEEQGEFFVAVGKTQSQSYIVITTGDHVTNESYVVSADATDDPIRLIAPRRAGHEYDVEHHGDHFYIRTNDRHHNFRLARVPTAEPSEAHWETVIEGSDHAYLTGLTCFRDFMAIEERIDGLDQIRIRDYEGAEHRIAFAERSYDASVGTNAEYATEILRVDYESMVTPQTVFDYHLADRLLETKKVRTVPSGYDPSLYRTERLIIEARDGARVPVSIVHRADFERDGNGPLLLYGYGAYGVAMTPYFATARLSLLDRGVAYAIAHVRGGDELGRKWYDDGKLDKRTNSFNDFIDVANGLIQRNYTGAGRIAIMGGSAGGTLVAAVANETPHLWGAVVAQVPFVDVLNTILDEDLPLTPLEWPEWGNPVVDREAFEYIASWSPYDRIDRQDYPPMLVTAGLNDPRVGYWEAAKYVAKLRTLKTDGNALLLKVNMGAGHGGRSGRYEHLKEVAEEYAFVLNALRVE